MRIGVCRLLPRVMMINRTLKHNNFFPPPPLPGTKLVTYVQVYNLCTRTKPRMKRRDECGLIKSHNDLIICHWGTTEMAAVTKIVKKKCGGES